MTVTALGSANTPTGLTTPDLISYIRSAVKQSGTSFSNSEVAPLLGQFGMPHMSDIEQQLKNSGYTQSQVHKVLNSGPGLFQYILAQVGQSAVMFPPSDVLAGGGAAGEAAATGAASAGGVSASTLAGGAALGGLGIANSIGSVTDFLSWIAWLFHPLNILRAAEFLFGIIIGSWGLYLVTKGMSQHSATGAIRRVISVTPAGRTIRRAEGRRMGRHEGQREAARMEARQAETRSQRESSAVERERINLNARKTARETGQ